MTQGDWTDRVPELAGEFVRVREVVCADAPALFELLADPPVAEQMTAPPQSTDGFAGFIEWARRERASGHSICFGIVPHGLESAIGVIQIRALEPSFFTAEWGFAIGVAFWGTGVFLEAAYLVAQFAFEQMRVHRIEARAVVQNGRANGALKKLGARPEGELKNGFRRDDRRDHQILWSLAAADLQQPPLVREPFSQDKARQAIRRAIDRVTEAMHAAERRRPHAPPPLFPFFITRRP